MFREVSFQTRTGTATPAERMRKCAEARGDRAALVHYGWRVARETTRLAVGIHGESAELSSRNAARQCE
jgi:hypothetical protein